MKDALSKKQKYNQHTTTTVLRSIQNFPNNFQKNNCFQQDNYGSSSSVSSKPIKLVGNFLVYFSIYLSIYLSSILSYLYLSVYLSINPCIHPSIHPPSICLSIYMSIYLLIYLPTYLFIFLSI